MVEIETGVAKAAIECVVLVPEFPGGDSRGNFGECFWIEAKRLAHFARRHAIAISNDIRGHGRAAFAVAAIDVLDHLFAFVTARQVKIDIRPLATLLGKKTL